MAAMPHETVFIVTSL